MGEGKTLKQRKTVNVLDHKNSQSLTMGVFGLSLHCPLTVCNGETYSEYSKYLKTLLHLVTQE